MLKTFTKVKFSGQNNDNNRNIKDSMTIASWEISDGTCLNLRILDAENKKGMDVTMATEKRTLTIKLNIFLKIMTNEFFV